MTRGGWGGEVIAGTNLDDSGPGNFREVGETEGSPHRVVVCTDIGGTDPDDFQSMVHLLVHADNFDIEDLVSSPYGLGRKEHILQVIDLYERDYDHLRTYCDQ